MERSEQGDFSRGSIARNIMRLGLPLMVAQLTAVLYNVVDRAYIGHIPGEGDLAITGIGLVMPIISIITAFSDLCGVGGGPLCAIARGRGDDWRAERIMGNAMTMLLVCSAGLMAAFYLFYRPLLYLFGASDATIGYATDYLMIYLAGTPFAMVSLGMNPFINCQGFGRTGMLTVLLGAVANTILDPIFIFGLDMGVRGAALATILSQAISAAWVLYFLTRGGSVLRLRIGGMAPDSKIIRRITALGLTGFTFGVTTSLVQALGNSLLFTYGSAAGGTATGDLYVGAMTIINSVREVINKPLQGITQGAQSVVSYNYGARLYSRVRESIRFLTKIGLLYNGIMWLLVLLLPRLFIAIFNNDPGLVEATVPSMRLYFICYVMMAFQTVGQNTFVALGRSRQAVFFSLLRKVFLVVPCMLVLPRLFGLGVYGVFLAEPVSDLIGGALAWGTMMLTVYRRMNLPDGEQLPGSVEL